MADLTKEIRNNPFAPPAMPPNPLAPPMMPPMPPPPTGVEQGFQSWASDVRNNLKVQPAMTSATSPLQPNAPAPMSAVYNPPAAQKPPVPTQDQDMAAHPDLYAKPVMGSKVGKVLTAIAATSLGAAGGMHGNPGAGAQYAMQVKAADDALGDQNTQTYNARIVQPQKDALDQQFKQAQIAHLGAETNGLQNKPAQTDKQIHAYVGADGKQHVIMLKPDNTTYDQVYGDVNQKDPAAKTQTPEQQFIADFMGKHPKAGIGDAVKAYSAATQKPEREPKQLGVAPDGTVIELRPGMKIPQGTQSVSGELKGSKPTADEQRRADLAKNLNENFDKLEDILKRRPELFGPMAGRLTSLKNTFGTSDPDIAALETIKHQVGMAQISAHGMRSAQGIEGAAQSLLNNFNNSPAAMMGGINAARQSVGTFIDDANNPGANRDTGAKPHPFTPPTQRSTAPAASGPKVGTVEGGFRFKGGDPSNPKNWEKAR
jgi:hypothetical protein